jgi:predicted nucleotidyltransferase
MIRFDAGSVVRFAPGSMNAGAAQAETLLREAASAYRAALGERLLAAYALGSLAHGGFSSLVSDIDLGLIVKDPVGGGDAERVEAIAREQRAKPVPLADRLSVFWGTRSTLADQSVGGRFPPLDRLDLLENGRLLVGVDARSGLPRPAPAELLTVGAQFALEFLAGVRPSQHAALGQLGSMQPAGEDAVEQIRCPDRLMAAGVRRLTKLALFPVRFLFTAATGRVGTNDAAVDWYVANDEAVSRRLVASALAWRSDEPTDHHATAALLREELVPLYLHFIDDHITRLHAVGRSDLVSSFTDWRTRLMQ